MICINIYYLSNKYKIKTVILKRIFYNEYSNISLSRRYLTIRKWISTWLIKIFGWGRILSKGLENEFHQKSIPYISNIINLYYCIYSSSNEYREFKRILLK